ncbi:MAG: hypothetical protein HOD92_24885 [Deltaproteobacteria bacterium]|jgi:hypothetical protein|nr:hypothetical protein [Deltaproteobacteria bacterium]MBT4527391.1 hypothetical protein [Deltaproteobacteria bacterium]
MMGKIGFIVLLFFILSIHSTQATPTIIQDQRVSNIGATPILGRGYSISTNSYQSNCFSKIEQTSPSYDFVYQFTPKTAFLKEGTDENTGLNNTLHQMATDAFKQKIFKSNNDSDKKTKKIIVSIQLNSYYASLDESQAALSASAAALIKNRDLPAFFSSCGSYYIKSMMRNAVFLAEFKFESFDSDSDLSFVNLLESSIKSFNPTPVNRSNPALKTEQNLNHFSQTAKKRRLTIFVAAFGLGFKKKVSLISHDIESFKTAIRNAFILMQNPNTGKVTAIEVIPWVENTEFQSLLYANEQKNTPQYEKKYNISMNAGLLAEIDRVDRGLLDTYYKAKICRQYIDDNWKQIEGNQMELKPVYKNRYLMNNYDNNSSIQLSSFDKYLTKETIESLYQKHQQVIYGTNKQQGARKCISELHKVGLDQKNFRDLEPCNDIEKQLINFNFPIIDDYCMPILFDARSVPKTISTISSY